ncbi:MAG: MAPEG family protein, partial [bacterium]
MLEYSMLALSALLYQFVWLPEYLAKWVTYSYDHMASNRNQEGLPELPEWGKRAGRAQDNYVENFPPFAVVVLLLGLVDGFTVYTGIATVV